jgi:glycopeptide antibiotics resistance protein
LAVELTQLTGIWGLYPCPYRQFDVDDLILNTTGVVIGFALARVLRSFGSVRSGAGDDEENREAGRRQS